MLNLSYQVLPAHAGVILAKELGPKLLKGITRTCGGDPQMKFMTVLMVMYYPHMRG